MHGKSRRRFRWGPAGPVSLLLAMLVVASCAGTGGRCVYRYATDNSKGGQMRWGACNNQDPMMHRVFGPDQGSDTR